MHLGLLTIQRAGLTEIAYRHHHNGSQGRAATLGPACKPPVESLGIEDAVPARTLMPDASGTAKKPAEFTLKRLVASAIHSTPAYDKGRRDEIETVSKGAVQETDAMSTHWVIDWKRINSLEDLKALLRACELQPRPTHPSFELLKPFCKQIDDDGREVPEVETASAP